MSEEERARILARRYCYGITFTPNPELQKLIEDAYVAGYMRRERAVQDAGH